MRRDDSARLLDMLQAAREAVLLVEGMSFEEFERDRRTQLSILKLVELVGEAAGRVSQDVRQANAAIEWRRIVDTRNHFVHDYFEVSQKRVWNTARNDLPDLIAHLEPLVPPESNDD